MHWFLYFVLYQQMIQRFTCIANKTTQIWCYYMRELSLLFKSGLVYRLPQSIAYFQNNEINGLIGHENLYELRIFWIYLFEFLSRVQELGRISHLRMMWNMASSSWSITECFMILLLLRVFHYHAICTGHISNENVIEYKEMIFMHL